MATKALPSQEVLRQLLDYDPDTGALAWRIRSGDDFENSAARSASHICAIWNVRYAGKPAFTSTNGNGYLSGHIKGYGTTAHRVIWKWLTGQEPDQIDHINGNRSDNRWENLRDVTWAENARNHRRRKDNTTGIAGVYWYPHERKTGKWLAKIGSQHIGYFDTFEAAVAARKQAERELGFHENHGRAA